MKTRMDFFQQLSVYWHDEIALYYFILLNAAQFGGAWVHGDDDHLIYFHSFDSQSRLNILIREDASLT